MISDLKQEN